MTRIAFLACAGTLPGPGPRRGDAFEHDIEVAALRPAFEASGLELVEIDWRAPIAEFAGARLALLGTAWDYQDHPEAFLARLDELEQAGVIVCNSAQITRWNAGKTYLRELADRGVPTIPTRWLEDADAADIAAALDEFAADRVVIKRQVGAGAFGQEDFARDRLPPAGWRFGRPCMVQPFLASILEEGELTFLFIDGAFSHAVRKRPAAGDYRIQSLYGGLEEVHDPSPEQRSAAQAVIDALPFAAPLYARIDMVRLPDGTLALIEAEMIEPFLYPRQGPELGERMAQGVLRRLG